MEAAARAGARHAGYVLLRLPHELRQMFEDWLQHAFPGSRPACAQPDPRDALGRLVGRAVPSSDGRQRGLCGSAAEPLRPCRAAMGAGRGAGGIGLQPFRGPRCRCRCVGGSAFVVLTSVIPGSRLEQTWTVPADAGEHPAHDRHPCHRRRRPGRRLGRHRDAPGGLHRTNFADRRRTLAPLRAAPLSKAMLAGDSEPPVLFFHEEARYAELGIELLLGTMVEALDPYSQRIGLRNGGTLPYDRLLVATGGRARRLTIQGGEHVHVLRTLEDSRAIRARLGRPNGWSASAPG